MMNSDDWMPAKILWKLLIISVFFQVETSLKFKWHGTGVFSGNSSTVTQSFKTGQIQPIKGGHGCSHKYITEFLGFVKNVNMCCMQTGLYLDAHVLFATSVRSWP